MIDEIKDIIQDLENVNNIYDYDLIVNFHLEQLERFTSKELVNDTLKDIKRIDNGELTEKAIYIGTKTLICELEHFSIDWSDKVDVLYDIILSYNVASEKELRLAIYFNGYSSDTLNHVIYYKRGYHDFVQLAVSENIEIDLNDWRVL